MISSFTSTCERPERRKRGKAGWIQPVEREELISRARLLDENDVPRGEIAEALNVSPGMITQWLGARRQHRRRRPKAQAKRRGPDHRSMFDAIETDTVKHESIGTYFDAAPPREICESIAEATGRSVVDRSTFQLGPTSDSDEMPWYDEPEAELPKIPTSKTYYANLRRAYDDWNCDRHANQGLREPRRWSLPAHMTC